MSSPDPYSVLSREDLVQLILEQQRQIAELQAELEQLRRAGKGSGDPITRRSSGSVLLWYGSSKTSSVASNPNP